MKTPKPKLSEHKQYDVVVYKSGVGAIYGIAYYMMENDTLREGGWGVGRRDDDYDVAYYRWKNDTTLVVRLYNSATKEQKIVTITGTSKSSTAEVSDR